MNGSVWTLVIAAAGVLGGIIGTITTRIGKRGDQELESVRDQFGRLISEVNYWRETATDTRTEWEQRWDRQMVRCRKITDALAAVLIRLLRPNSGAADREAAEAALQDLREHNDTDH